MIDLQGRVALVTGGGRDVGAAISQSAGRSRRGGGGELSRLEGRGRGCRRRDQEGRRQGESLPGRYLGCRRRQAAWSRPSRATSAASTSWSTTPAWCFASASAKARRRIGRSRSIPASMARSIAATAPAPCWKRRAAGASSPSWETPRASANPDLALAAAARAGTIALMKSLAREWGRSGVTANSISLGLIESAHDKTWVEANREKLVKAYPIRRLGHAVRRRADGGAARIRRRQLDHRPGDQHQRRIQHGLRGGRRCCTWT